jgi:hypothetical protein
MARPVAAAPRVSKAGRHGEGIVLVLRGRREERVV